jgi:transcriptional regulator with XRE-family HTH domain
VLRCQFERLRQKKTQDDIAHITGITQSDISAIERRRLNPTPKELEALSGALGVPADCLLEEVVPVEQSK